MSYRPIAFTRALNRVYRRAAEYVRSVLGALAGNTSRRALNYARIPSNGQRRPLSRNPASRMVGW
jgi:hypothetical protein